MLTEVPVPVPNTGEVLIRVKVSAICGSERKDYLDGCSFISGHEFAGEVAETNRCNCIAVGDRVAVNVISGCGSCYFCQTGSPQLCSTFTICHGGHGEYAVVPERCCIRLPEDLDYETGVLVGGDTQGVAFRTAAKLRPNFGRIAVVSGAGPIGLGVVATLKYHGYYVVVAEPGAYRRAFARTAAGADEALNPQEQDLGERIDVLTEKLGADAVIECSGNPRAQLQALELVRPQGTVVYSGENYKGMEIIPSLHIIHKEVTLTGAFYFNQKDFHGLCRMIRRGFAPLKLVSHHYPLQEAPQAFRQFFSGESGKVLICR